MTDKILSWCGTVFIACGALALSVVALSLAAMVAEMAYRFIWFGIS